MKKFSNKKTMKRQRRLVMGSCASPSPSATLGQSCLQQIHERTTSVVTSVAGLIGLTYAIAPNVLLTAARLTGYRALADEVRIDFVRLILTPVLGASSTGRTVLYIERDPSAALVATTSLADDQREKVVGRIDKPLTMSWRPQEPADLEFNLLNPGTVSLGQFAIVGDNITDANAAAFAGTCYNMQFLVAMTLRGRP